MTIPRARGVVKFTEAGVNLIVQPAPQLPPAAARITPRFIESGSDI